MSTTQTAKRDPNRVETLLAASNDGTLNPVDVTADPITGRLLVSAIISSSVVPGINIPAWDYVANTSTSTTDTYVFKNGGAGGTSVATIAIVYTDSSKGTLSTVTKT